jgi:hypothetical protein
MPNLGVLPSKGLLTTSSLPRQTDYHTQRGFLFIRDEHDAAAQAAKSRNTPDFELMNRVLRGLRKL